MGKDDHKYIVNFFNSIKHEIISKKEHTTKTIIYVNTKKEVNLLNNGLASRLGSALFLSGKEGNPRYRLVEEFHADSPRSIKQHVLEQASIRESHLRVVICTSAFGMGVNIKGFNRCIHYGPPSTVETFVQEVGRVGRDGSQSESILIFHKSLASHASSEMVEYSESTIHCRRQFLMAKFPGNYSSLSSCLCCDCCAKNCKCGKLDCFKKSKKPLSDDPAVVQRRNVLGADRVKLRGLLNDFRIDLFNKKKAVKQVSLPNLFHEFTEHHIKQIMANITTIFDRKDLKLYVEIWRTSHAVEILKLINSVFNDIEANEIKDPKADVCEENTNLYDAPGDVSFMDDTTLCSTNHFVADSKVNSFIMSDCTDENISKRYLDYDDSDEDL